jgi:hypothetical protein
MFRAVVEEAAALASIALFIGMIAVWAHVIAVYLIASSVWSPTSLCPQRGISPAGVEVVCRNASAGE